MNNTLNVIGTGLNGLVGSKVVSELADRCSFENIDIRHPISPVDITNEQQVMEFFNRSSAQVVLHCAAFTDVTAAWHQRGEKDGLAYQINVLGTKNIAQACAQTGKYLVHLSTAYVFDGTKPTPYLESDTPNPIEWYGQTKLEAEQMVQEFAQDWAIVRIDQPFRSDKHLKLDVVHRIIQQLNDGTLPPQFEDHTFGPTYINDLARHLGWFLETKTTGIFHGTSGESWTDYKFATQIASLLGRKETLKPGSLQAYLKTTQRPYQANTSLNIGKLLSLLPYKPIDIVTALEQTVTRNASSSTS